MEVYSRIGRHYITKTVHLRLSSRGLRRSGNGKKNFPNGEVDQAKRQKCGEAFACLQFENRKKQHGSEGKETEQFPGHGTRQRQSETRAASGRSHRTTSRRSHR